MATIRSILVAAVALSIGACQPKQEEHVARGTAPPDSSPEERVAALLSPAASGHLIRNFEVDRLRQQGLSDPVRQIVAGLMTHPELIRHPGVLGGTMGFCVPENVHVLDERWVYADFEDGHIGGHGIFAYKVQPDSSLSFSVVYSELD